MFLDTNIAETLEYIKDRAEEARASWWSTIFSLYKIRQYLAGAMEESLPENAGTLLVLSPTPSELHMPH